MSANAQAFSLTLRQSYFDQANQYLGDMRTIIADAEALSANSTFRLIVLRKNSTEARDRLKQRHDLFGEASLTQRLLPPRGAADVAAQSFQKLGSSYLADQDNALQRRCAGRRDFPRPPACLPGIKGLNELFGMVNALDSRSTRPRLSIIPPSFRKASTGLLSFGEDGGRLRKPPRGMTSPLLQELASQGRISPRAATSWPACRKWPP